MNKQLPLVLILLLCVGSFLHGEAYPDPSPYPNMGDYEGFFEKVPDKGYWSGNPLLAAQVIVVDERQFRVRILPELDKRCPAFLDVVLEKSKSELAYGDETWRFTVNEGTLSGFTKDGDDWFPFVLKRKERFSPSLGAPPPEGAVVLFDGTSLDMWEHGKGQDCTWRLTGDGAMEVVPQKSNPKGLGSIFSREKFKDCRLHIEFRYPVEEGKTGQARGNSGVFLMGYEVQVLNSYGLEGYYNECGALYKLAAPLVNAAAPPLQWQTYDIEFTAPRFDDSGQKTANGRISVWHNGILIQDDREIPYQTSHSQLTRYLPAPREALPIQLQDHSNLIQYRNIWVVRK